MKTKYFICHLLVAIVTGRWDSYYFQKGGVPVNEKYKNINYCA